MEITILGKYRPFGEVRDTITAVRQKATTVSTLPPFLSPESNSYVESCWDDSHTTSTRGEIALPRYELYPPTQDGIINDSPESKTDTAQSNFSKGKIPRGYDVEVSVKGSKVTWTQGGVLRKILDFSSENETVQQTLFAWFIVNNPSQKSSGRVRDRERDRDDDYDVEPLNSAENPGADRQGRQQALVIILKDTARIYFSSGESYSVYLPFAVHKVWAMDLGLLMERKQEPGEEISEEMEGTGLPKFYMIMDPLNELQIVTLYRLPKKIITPQKLVPQEDAPRIRHMNGIVGDIFNTCVFLSNLDADDRTVVTFDLLQKRHRVWQYASSMPSALPFSRMQSQAGPTNTTAMEIENDADLQMRTDTYLFEIESNIQAASQNATIFSAHMFDGSTVIGVLDHEAEKLSCYQIIADQITVHLWTKPALSAVAVEATRRQQRDILILSHKGALHLWTGYAAELVPCNVNIASEFLKRKDTANQTLKKAASSLRLGNVALRSTKTSGKSAADDDTHIIEMRDPVENRLNFVLNDGIILRAHLDFTVRSSLVQQCLDAISYALPVDVLWDFKLRFLQLQFDNMATYADISSGEEWDNFTTTLLSYCDPSFTPPVMSSPVMSRAQLGSSKKPTVSESDWDFFLDSDMHHMLGNHPSFRNEPLVLPVSTSSPFTEMITQAQKLATLHFRGPATRQSLRLDLFYKFILVALHLIYEDRNINLTTCNEGDMAPLLILMSHIVRWGTWVDAYVRRDFSGNKNLTLPEVYMEGPTLPLEPYEHEPPDIFRWISDMVSHPKETKPFPTLVSLALLRDPEQSIFPVLASAPGDQTRKVTLFFTALMTSEDDGDQSAVQAIVGEAFTDAQLDQMPFGVSVPLREALWKCRRNPSPDLSPDALSFIGRNDLAELASKQGPGYYMKPPSKDNIESTKRQDVHSLCEDVVHQEGDSELEITGAEITESDIMDLRFGADMRVAETKKMLQSSMVLKVRPKESPHLNEEDLTILHQETLIKLAQRTLALPVGRAILTFGTATPILNQKCPIPPVTLSAKLLPSYGVMELDVVALGGDKVLRWPTFHNGVAAGLRISPNSKDVSSSWIIYNRPDTLDSSHAGFLFALGLTGHLRALVRSHVWRYLSFKHEFTSMGLLLGLACAHRGTMNTAITRVLSVHMPALLPQNGSELNLSPVTQVACVLGIGLIYMETSHRRMAEVMLSEIGSASGDVGDSANNLQECHSVTAGFGLGFITLGQGNKPTGLRDMKIVDILISYMPGSTDKDHGARAPNASANGDEQEWNRRHAGINVTSAGATIAMGLMYLKTNSKNIAAKLSVPETHFLLDYVTPDALMLRVICRAIILWGSIVPTKAWLLSQVPDYLKDIKTGGPPKSSAGPQSYFSILAGACFAMGLRFAGSGNEAAYECILYYMDMFTELGPINRDGSYEDSITKSTIRTCLDVTTMAASMVVAGSGRIDFLRRLRKLHRRIKGDTSYGSHLAYHMAMGLLFLGGGGYTLGTSNRCVAALLCSLYPRLPSDPADNRSHLQAFRHLWVLAVEPRCLVTRDASTGACCPVPVRVHLKATYYQSQIQMGLGRMNPIDHHQEAAQAGQESQGTIYTGLNSNVSQDADTALFSNTKLNMMTPCLLPELSTISKIEILGPRYRPITIDLSSETEDYSRIWRILKTRFISVIRHIGHLSYTEDALGMRGILARPFPKVLTSVELGESTENGGSRRRKVERLQQQAEALRGKNPGIVWSKQHGISNQQDLEQSSASYGEDFCLTFLQDPQVAAFANHLCRVQQSDREYGTGVMKDEARTVYFTNVLYECLTMDKVEVLGVHVWLYDIANRLESLDELSWRTLWELRILMNYYDTQLRRHLSEAEEALTTGRVARGGRTSKRRPAGSDPMLALAAHMMEDDGSETLIKISRVTELVSKITKRVEQVMEDSHSDSQRPGRSLDRTARYYFANGKLPSSETNSSKRASFTASEGFLDSEMNAESRSKTDWFKVWLELNEVPGPDAIQAIRRALDKTRQDWKAFDEDQEMPSESESGDLGDHGYDENDDRDGSHPQQRQTRARRVSRMAPSAAKREILEGQSKLLKQVFSLAFPAVSTKVLDYLKDDERPE
ncbi:Anaphase-promoting complex subunit 1 [Dissophora ornata]|nr:Anaphase-promoting complex subunit 1 [Dissophora ornata]